MSPVQLTQWETRPREVAHLLNPAFLGLLIVRTAEGFAAEGGGALSYPHVFVGLPIVLHRPTRELLPRTVRTRMGVWLERTPAAQVGFARRARELVPFVREAIAWTLTRRALVVTEDGGLAAGPNRVAAPRAATRALPGAVSDVEECARAATFVGRWLAGAGRPSTVYAQWGIRP